MPHTVSKAYSGARLALLGLAGLLVCGCVTVPDPDQSKPMMVTKVTDGSRPSARSGRAPTTAPAPAANLANAIDSCGDQMHDLCGSILEYYLVHRQLPPRLEDLQGNVICPVAGVPYVFVTGKLVDTHGWRLVLHDATPVHTGRRWAIVDKTVAGGAPIMEPILLNDAHFKAFAPALPAPN